MLVLCVLTANTSFRNIYVWTGMPGTGAWYEPGRACVRREAAFQLISALLEGDGRDLLSCLAGFVTVLYTTSPDKRDANT